MSKIDPNKLLISSDFYSVQGEGISSGVPSYFVRLGICNLTCGMSRAFANMLAKEQKLEDGEIFEGDLHKEGKATWTCDSTSQWLWRGEDKEFQYLIDRWKEQGIYDDIKNGTIHIIWTGGEPTIKGHQEAIVNFHKYWLLQVDPSTTLPGKEYDFVVPFSIPLKNVVCMPGLDDVANFEERTQFCLEMAKKYKFRGLTRLHIAAWNKTLNV
jgi:organic radical activating enzyme